jgi:peptide/nickel transport system permease protein
MATYKTRTKFLLKRFVNFLKIFLRNKRGLAGLLIIIGFVIMAFIGPLTTPYNPTEDRLLAARRAAPLWLKYLPPALGGTPGLSENMYPIEDPGFKNPVTFDPTTSQIGEWKFSKTHISISDPEYDPDIGVPSTYRDGSGNGSLKITFSRKTNNATYGPVIAYLNKTFYFPYPNLPGILVGSVALLINGTTCTFQDMEILRIPVYITYFLQPPGQEAQKLWPITTLKTWKTENATPGQSHFEENRTYVPAPFLESSTTAWRLPQDPSANFLYSGKISSESGPLQTYYGNIYHKAPIFALFPTAPGNYTVGLEIIFEDNPMPTTNETRNFSEKEYLKYKQWSDLRLAQQNWNHTVEVTIHIDDLKLVLLGNAFGRLGTDNDGRDLYTQLVYGAGISLYVGLLASILGVGIGLIVGLAAGYLGRLADEILMRFSDILLVLPGLPLLIVLMAVLGAKLENLIILLGLLGWMGFAKLVRSQVLSIRERPFVEAAKAVGAGRTHIIIRHILPNIVSLVYVTLATTVPSAIVSEAALSWLGFFDPKRMSWGRMLHDSFVAGVAEKWWWIIPPGLCIAAIAVAFVLLGYALDDVLNPKLRIRK